VRGGGLELVRRRPRPREPGCKIEEAAPGPGRRGRGRARPVGRGAANIRGRLAGGLRTCVLRRVVVRVGNSRDNFFNFNFFS
jgi:hypothetical protein